MGTNTDKMRRPLGATRAPGRKLHGGQLPFAIANAFVGCITHGRSIALRAVEFSTMTEAEQRLFLKSLRSLDDDLAAVVAQHTGQSYHLPEAGRGI